MRYQSFKLIFFAMFLVLELVKSIRISIHCFCSWCFYWLKLFKSRFLSLFLVLLMVKSIQTRFHYLCFCYFCRSNLSICRFISTVLVFSYRLHQLKSLSFLWFLVLLLIKSIEIFFHFHSYWFFYSSDLSKYLFISLWSEIFSRWVWVTKSARGATGHMVFFDSHKVN